MQNHLTSYAITGHMFKIQPVQSIFRLEKRAISVVLAFFPNRAMLKRFLLKYNMYCVIGRSSCGQSPRRPRGQQRLAFTA